MMKSMNANCTCIIIWIGSILLLFSCEKDLSTFSGEDGVYFCIRKQTSKYGWSKEMYDTTEFAYTYIPLNVKDTVVRLRINAQGSTSQTDREIAWSVAETSTAVSGEEYVINERLVIPADSTHTWLEVLLKRPENLKREKKMLTLELHENEHFSLNRPWYEYSGSTKRHSLVQHTLVFHEVMGDWPNVKLMEPYFGKFSRTKIDFMCSEEVGLNLESMDFNNSDYMTPGRIMYIGQKVKKVLDIRKAGGNPVMDGTDEMTMGKNIK